jgi:hypothetical protein
LLHSSEASPADRARSFGGECLRLELIDLVDEMAKPCLRDSDAGRIGIPHFVEVGTTTVLRVGALQEALGLTTGGVAIGGEPA